MKMYRNLQRDPLKVPENLDALNDLTNETFTDHVAFGKHVVNFYFPQGAAAQVSADRLDNDRNYIFL